MKHSVTTSDLTTRCRDCGRPLCASNGCGWCRDCVENHRCSRCLFMLAPDNPGRVCKICRLAVALNRVLRRQSSRHRPSTADLHMRLAYYSARAANTLPLFEQIHVDLQPFLPRDGRC